MKDSDVFVVTILDEIEGDEEPELKEGWDDMSRPCNDIEKNVASTCIFFIYWLPSPSLPHCRCG